VAEELDVTKAALYYYVKDKEDLLFRLGKQRD
jgi:AcrR family transcriptional regulator